MKAHIFFKRSFVVSFCAHLCVFAFFSFSFKPFLVSAPVHSIVYLGKDPSFSYHAVHLKKRGAEAGEALLGLFNRNRARSYANISFNGARNKGYAGIMSRDLKPRIAFVDGESKLGYSDKLLPADFVQQQKAPVFIFHPILPAGFSLYFKDRQLAHVELSYRMPSGGAGHLLPVVKRKVSSGNLEADLLCKRYITNYLFARQMALAPSVWQVVKIDLSGTDDER